MTVAEIASALAGSGAPGYSAGQIFSWLHKQGARSFRKMTNLPASLRKQLEEQFSITTLSIVEEQRSKDGTLKFLVEFEDGLQVETVLLSEGRRKTQCVSTQVGCTLGCVFCATASLGFKRNLTAGEIIAQVEDITSYERRPGNLVFMGMGEPFLNYDNLMKAVRILNNPEGLNIGARKMTISTAGIPEGIRRFAEEDIQVRLALSLNAATDERRSRLMPVNKKHPLGEVLDSLRFYCEKTGRRITFEYVLVPGKNDSDADLRHLIDLARDLDVNINLIELNPGSRKMPDRTDRGLASKWKSALLNAGIEAVVRLPRGIDINAGCGQLALRRKND